MNEYFRKHEESFILRFYFYLRKRYLLPSPPFSLLSSSPFSLRSPPPSPLSFPLPSPPPFSPSFLPVLSPFSPSFLHSPLPVSLLQLPSPFPSFLSLPPSSLPCSENPFHPHIFVSEICTAFVAICLSLFFIINIDLLEIMTICKWRIYPFCRWVIVVLCISVTKSVPICENLKSGVWVCFPACVMVAALVSPGGGLPCREGKLVRWAVQGVLVLVYMDSISVAHQLV